jgi:ketosteroid isomerase-like protein
MTRAARFGVWHPSPMAPSNVELVRSIYDAWGRGDFRSTAWAHSQIEFERADSLEPGVRTGVAEMASGWRDWLDAWVGYRTEADEFRVLDGERVLVAGRMSGRGKTSGAVVETRFVNVFHVRDGKVTRLVLYSDPEQAFADLGLTRDDDKEER